MVGVKFYQASTSELFGLKKEINNGVLNERSKFEPQSPYATSKLFAYETTALYRKTFNLFAVNGILFNHESERRGAEFVTRKITLGLGEWLKSKTPIELGNLDSRRDWGHAQDYVEAMWLMLQQPEPEDFVIGTGETRSIREFIQEALDVMGISATWEGHGEDEVCRVGDDIIVKVNPEFYRPAEVDLLVADATKARQKLGWFPKVSFKELVKRMVLQDTK